MVSNKPQKNENEDVERNSNWQGVDKEPGEEKGKGEKVTKEDLKGKKVDGNPEKESDQPASIIPEQE